jgi:nicotinate dehydrogenase subunit B
VNRREYRDKWRSMPDESPASELAQHEAAGRLHRFDLDRREFLKLLGGGVLVCAAAPAAVTTLAQESGRARGRPEPPPEIAAWLHIGKDGRITVFTGKVEVGQNIRTSLTQLVAEELRAPLAAITLVMGDTDRVPFDMGTFGSRTTPSMAPILARAAAAAREALVDLAAARWKTERSSLVAEDGKIVRSATRQSLSYGELTRGENLVRRLDPEPTLTSPADWKVAGRRRVKVNGRAFVTGAHAYASDMTLPGMLHGRVLRPVGFKATLASLDAAAAEAIPGIRVVRDGDFVGVVAPDAWSAARALEALKAQWRTPPGQPSNHDLFEYLKKNAQPPDPDRGHATGSVETGLASAPVHLSATYEVAYIAHAPLEPRAAVAQWIDGKLTVWTGTQRPFGVREELAELFRIPTDKVRVQVPDTGSAYGGKHQGDAAVEAARLAKAAGKPVKVVWSREEEFTWAYFRPAGVIEIRSGASRDGAMMAWEFHNYNSGPSGIGTPYEVPNQSIAFHPVESPLRQGSYRALAATANNFARESHMDELAHAIGMDPLAFRLKNLADPRLRAVFEAAARTFGWDQGKTGAGLGHGIAGGTEKGGYTATCAEVEVEAPGRRVRVRRLVTAFECGAVVSPDGVRNQVEGAVLQGIGGALFEAVRFGNGRIDNPRFSQYRVPRFTDVPELAVVILDRMDLPSAGAGETPIVGVAPAIGNAVFAASGVRLRALPMLPDGRVPEPKA